jgi:hypothetical protein
MTESVTEEAYAGTDSFYPTSLEVTDVRGTATSSSPAPVTTICWKRSRDRLWIEPGSLVDRS